MAPSYSATAATASASAKAAIADGAAWDHGASSLVEHTTTSGTADQVRAKVNGYLEQGVTEIAYQPTGDVPRELEAFAAAVRST